LKIKLQKSIFSKQTSFNLTSNSELNFALGHEQKVALAQLRHFWNSKDCEFFLIKGFAGTGKSTLCSVFLSELPSDKVRLSATTHKAVAVLHDKCRELGLDIHTCTIYNMLHLVPQQMGDKTRLRQIGEPQLDGIELIVIDECSMISRELWNFLQDLPFEKNIKLLFMGDPAQLPPIHETLSPTFSIPQHCSLTEIFRQEKNNPILDYSLKLRHAQNNPALELPLPIAGDTIHLFQNEQTWQSDLIQSYHHDPQGHYPHQLQILAWTNRRVDKWNSLVQRNIFPTKRGPFSTTQPLILTSPIIKGGWSTPQQLIMANNESVRVIASRPLPWRGLTLWELDLRSTEGHAATIIYIAPEQKELVDLECHKWAQERHAKVDGTALIEKWRQRCVGVQPSAALTVHRSQGSSFNTVYLDLPSILQCKDRQQCLQLLYVAVTRAKNQLKVLMPSPSHHECI